MRVRVSVRHIFLLLMCVRACVRVCAFFILYFFTMVCILFRINFQIHLISHALRLAGSVSIGAVVGFRRKIDHHWLMFFSFIAIFFNQYTRSTDKTCSTFFKVVQLDPLTF